MNIGQVLNGVYDDELGWRPASGGVKPVHVANGLVRAVSRRTFDLTALIEVIAWRKGGAPIPERRLEALLERDWGDRLEAFRKDPAAFERMRRYLRGVLAADGAVFPSAEHSSVSLTCAQMASRDNNDRGLGEFGLSLLGDSSSPLVKLLAERLRVDAPSDPLTIAAWPLLVDEGRNTAQSERSSVAAKRRHSQSIMAEFKAAAASLASHEELQGNRLRSIERAAHFVCLATHAHAQALSVHGKLEARPPALLVTDVAKGSDLATASERSLRLVHDAFAGWLGEKLSERIAAGKPWPEGSDLPMPSSTDGREARKFLRAVGVAKKPHDAPDDDLLNERMSAFSEARRRHGKDEVAQCFGSALVECYLREFDSGGPWEALTRLCARAGLLYPHYQGRSAEKRFQPSAPMLELIVRACVSAEEAVPLDEFLERLWIRFGLVVGGRRNAVWDDSAYLHQHGLAVDPSRLQQNTDALVSQLATMGLARRYPDNVTFVGAAHAR